MFAALDTLENLRKGGRIGAARARLGSMLSVKPLIPVTDGAVAEAGKQRTRGSSLDRLIELAKEHGAANAKPLAVMHGDAPDIAQFVDKVCAALGSTRPASSSSATSARWWARTRAPASSALRGNRLARRESAKTHLLSS